MTLLCGSNRGYTHPPCHMSQSALGESEAVCWIVAVCVGGGGLAPLCPPNAASPPLAPRSFMSLLFRLSSPLRTEPKPRGAKTQRETERESEGLMRRWRENKTERQRKRCNLKLGISVTQIGVRCQESNNMAASESIYSPTV